LGGEENIRWAKRKDWKMFKTAMEVVLFENEIPKEKPDKQER